MPVWQLRRLEIALTIWELVKLSLTALAISIALNAAVAGAVWVIAQ
jgi:hypothetical protein